MNKRISIFTTALLFGSATMYAFSGQGSGTEKDPYLVTNADELFEVRNEQYAVYLQTEDIDLTEWIADNNPTQGWIPIVDFGGSYDGAHHTIKGLMINRGSSDNIGLFGSFAAETKVTVKNICLINPIISGNNNVGGIVGCVKSTYSDKDIKNNSIFGGTIMAENGIAGGVVGVAYYNISMTGNYYSLNIVGNSVACRIKGNIAGGICGQAQGSQANYQCYYVEVHDNLFNGNINANDYGGGIVGLIPQFIVKVYRNVAGGTLLSNGTVSGIVNRNNANIIEHNISIADTISANTNIYRICNVDDGNTSDNYARINTVGIIKGKYVDIDDNATNGIAVGDKTLMKQTTYHGYGFDFYSQWSIDEGITFPFEKHQSSKPLVNAFYAGSKAILTGEASNNSGKIIAIINDAVFDTNIIDSKWEVNVGNVPQNTMCMLSMISDGKSFSVPVNVCSQKNPNTDDVEHGDGNGDGAVDAADVVSIVNYILGKPSSSFNEKNADANGDGQILIDDAVGTVNIIMNKQ